MSPCKCFKTFAPTEAPSIAGAPKVTVPALSTKRTLSNVTFDKVLFVDNAGAITLGAPAITGASVGAKVLKHLQGDKVIVFKKKRRKGYKKKNGHRQALTQIVIEGINI